MCVVGEARSEQLKAYSLADISSATTRLIDSTQRAPHHGTTKCVFEEVPPVQQPVTNLSRKDCKYRGSDCVAVPSSSVDLSCMRCLFSPCMLLLSYSHKAGLVFKHALTHRPSPSSTHTTTHALKITQLDSASCIPHQQQL